MADDGADVWEAMLAAEAEAAEGGGADDPGEDAEAAAAWEAMLSETDSDDDADWSQDDNIVKVLNQDEIDSLLGFEMRSMSSSETKGIRALLDKALLSYERLPMLEIVFDRFVRVLSTSLRNFTSDNVDVDIRSITSLRFGDYINSIPMPALLTIFKALEWENFGIITVDGPLVYSMVDILFGGRRTTRPIRIEGRPYTTIEQSVVKQVAEIVLSDLGAAFDPLSPATFVYERGETNPRFATIARPADAVILLQLRVDMEERGGNMEIMFPYATLEPIRDLLMQVFMGEKFGKDSMWEHHLEKEMFGTDIEVEALLKKKAGSLKDIMQFKVGSTIIMDHAPDEDIEMFCSGVHLLSGTLGCRGNNVAISVNTSVNDIQKKQQELQGKKRN